MPEPYEVKTACPYCGVGCGLIATTDGEKLLSVRGDPQHPANFGRLCPKGATVAQTVDVTTRLRRAKLRIDRRDAFRDVTPADAVSHIAERLDRVLQSHGPQGIGFYLSGQLTTESQYVFNKFAKGCLRTNHVDSNSRLCMSSAATGMTLSLGSDGPPTCYEDIEMADTFVFIGSNAADAHPITFGRVARQLEKQRTACIVIDPRKTETAKAATVHLAIKPGSDLILLNGLLYLMEVWGKLDRKFIATHTEGWDELSAHTSEYPPSRVAETCGISIEDLIKAASLIGDARRLLTFWTMGVSQTISGTFAANAIINLHLALGQIGKPGSGPFSLTGQPNAMGGRSVGYMSHQLPGQRRLVNADHRREMEMLWNLSPSTIYPHVGYDAVRMFEALETGDIKALWIVGTNPAASMPNLPKIRSALRRADLVILQDAYATNETTPFAHVMLPAAVNLESDGTFCNSERTVTLLNQAARPPGDAQADWWWPRAVAIEMGLGRGLRFGSAAEIFDEFVATTAGRPDDQSGLSHNLLRENGPRQWPLPAGGVVQPRRYTDGVFPTPTGKARFFARAPIDTDEPPSSKFPLLLTTGRLPNQWHTRTKTGLVDALNKSHPEPRLQIHPDDAAALHIVSGDLVAINSRRGQSNSIAQLDRNISPGVVFLSIHFNELSGNAASPNEATSDSCDALSKQPSLKYCAVAVSKASAIVASRPQKSAGRSVEPSSPTITVEQS